MKRTMRALQKALVEGLVVLLPIALSLYVAHWIFSVFYRIFSFGLVFLPLAAAGLPWVRPLVAAATAAVTVIMIVALGLVVRTVAGRRLGRLAIAVMVSVPLTRSLFQAFRQLLRLLFSKPAPEQAHVVLVRFPHERSYAVGFVTGEASERLSGDSQGQYLRVFLPGTPNPSIGLLLIVPQGDIVRTGMSTEQALRLVVSGGVVQD